MTNDAPAPALAEIAAMATCLHIEAAVGVVVRVRTEHFVLLEYRGGDTRVYESDECGEIGGAWFPVIVAPTFALAVREFGLSVSVSFNALFAAIDQIRSEQTRTRCVPALAPATEATEATVAPVCMGGASPPLGVRRRSELVPVRPGISAKGSPLSEAPSCSVDLAHSQSG